MTPPLQNPYDYPPTEPVVTWDQVSEVLARLSLSVGIALHQQITNVTQAQAPGPFSSALGELEVYLDELDEAGLLSFDNQRLIKDYVMRGWTAWRESFVIGAR